MLHAFQKVLLYIAGPASFAREIDWAEEGSWKRLKCKVADCVHGVDVYTLNCAM